MLSCYQWCVYMFCVCASRVLVSVCDVPGRAWCMKPGVRKQQTPMSNAVGPRLWIKAGAASSCERDIKRRVGNEGAEGESGIALWRRGKSRNNTVLIPVIYHANNGLCNDATCYTAQITSGEKESIAWSIVICVEYLYNIDYRRLSEPA